MSYIKETSFGKHKADDDGMITHIITKNMRGDRVRITIGITRVVMIDPHYGPSSRYPLYGSDFESVGIVTKALSDRVVVVEWENEESVVIEVRALDVAPEFIIKFKNNPNHTFKMK